MLNVGAMEEGVVLDHIKAGKAMTIYKDLKLDQMNCCVAIITNAHSRKMGKKDILKVECKPEDIDLDVLGFYDSNITVNIITNGTITKRPLKQPKKIVNIIKCKNPRCITSIEQELDHVFVLTDEERKIYRCRYCEEAYHGRRNK
ncbi:MAG: aspartate carbamoyltransferase regulatory subunit [Lachnospiraceae bacterium]|nr:aspartate carbamoyltransferase regulatory subunit [Lachnospiraceae bacterium]